MASQMWFYATPVLYPVSMIPEEYRAALYLNPMASLILAWRALFLEGAPPLDLLAVSLAWSTPLVKSSFHPLPLTALEPPKVCI